MSTFSYTRADSFPSAAATLADKKYSLPMLKAGGMDIVDHLKEGLIAPDLLIDVRRIGPLAGANPIALDDGANGKQLVIAPMTTLAQVAASPLVREHAPALAQAAESAATPQVRNAATVAGNLLQRPRCWYYRSESHHCLKKGGATCFAVEGENRYHAIFGGGPCHIVHPSNLAPPLLILNGALTLIGSGRDSVLMANLYHLPDQGIRSEHNLGPGEVLTNIRCDIAPKSGFYAVKEKQSFDWPLVFAVVTLDMQGKTIRAARVCAGAVAPIPWLLPTVGQALVGVDPSDDTALRKACDLAADGARPMTSNAFKSRLLTVAVRRAVMRAAGLHIEEAT